MSNKGKMYVAVKALKENASAKTQGDFRREIELISDLKHDNIVCILGVVLKEEPLCMLFEYMTQGDLHEFLITNSPTEGKLLTQLQFLQISMQICDGMEYLASHHYVHRDLAARNCLVGSNLTVKISDFGLSRDIYSSDYYRVQSKSLLPVRWMPAESILYGKFTTESDVWSYGVVLWEIYSYGLQPYYGYSNQEVISMVRARQLLPCPESCPNVVYQLMAECWHEQAVRRPSFLEIGHRLKIWYTAQKRSEQNENSSNCGGSRKGSTFSIATSTNNRPSIAASSSSHHSLNKGGGGGGGCGVSLGGGPSGGGGGGGDGCFNNEREGSVSAIGFHHHSLERGSLSQAAATTTLPSMMSGGGGGESSSSSCHYNKNHHSLDRGDIGANSHSHSHQHQSHSHHQQHTHHHSHLPPPHRSIGNSINSVLSEDMKFTVQSSMTPLQGSISNSSGGGGKSHGKNCAHRSGGGGGVSGGNQSSQSQRHQIGGITGSISKIPNFRGCPDEEGGIISGSQKKIGVKCNNSINNL